MKIRKGFVPAAHGRPNISMTDHHKFLLKLKDAATTRCVQKVSDKTRPTERLSIIVDPDEEKCIATGSYRTTTNGSRKALWGNRKRHKEEEGAYRSSKGRCIMCGEAGHSCFQQLAASHAALMVEYCSSDSGIHLNEVPMPQKLEDVQRGERGQSSSDIHDGHVDQVRGSCHRKERYGKPETSTKKRPHTSAHNDDAILGCVNGNKLKRKGMIDSPVAGKRNQNINAPSKFLTPPFIEQPQSEIAIVPTPSSKDRLILEDSLLQSGMIRYVAAAKGDVVDRKPSNETMFEPPRTSLIKRATSGNLHRAADLRNRNLFLQELFNRQGHLSQLSNVDPKAYRQRDSDGPQASVKQHRHLHEEGNACLWAKPPDSTTSGCNLETTTDQKPCGALDRGHRCKRMDGKGWQCLRQAEPGFSLCEYHLSRFRANHNRRKAAKIVKDAMPSETELSGRKRSKKNSSEATVADHIVADPLPEAFQRKRKPVKARSIMSIQ
ncbi:hypothetical protein O6H91_01G122900 [Diphasiastrum complanatum]|uniref:Uncharacterized protein n=1 Tax=Diphasiastrum complanatum TaxID=34168 RepID=A0ACC2EVP0_DIPCM|nr:hypothetical protein O6H91_01G122900 [Diphasiastrum complanatum]